LTFAAAGFAAAAPEPSQGPDVAMTKSPIVKSRHHPHRNRRIVCSPARAPLAGNYSLIGKKGQRRL